MGRRGLPGVQARPEVAGDEHLSRVEFRVAERPGRVRGMSVWDREAESGKASVRAKVGHLFLVVKRDFGFRGTRYRGLVKNLNHVNVLCASANLLTGARAEALERALRAAG